MMTKVNLSVLLATACLSGWATVASAGPVTINNTTEVETYTGTSPSNGFFSGGAYWGGNIGAPTFNTPSATISWSNSNTVNIAFTTGLYHGVDSAFSPTVYGADVFLKSGGGATLPGLPGSSFFNYAISLGFDTADGGNTQTPTGMGLYALPVNPTDGTTYKTSRDVWSGRSGDTYGGAYAAAGACAVTVSACANSTASPTVLLAGQGTKVSGITVTTSSVAPTGGGTAGTLNVQLVGSGNINTPGTGLNTLASLFKNFDIFWGTGDCSNAPIWGNVASLTRSVPEPSSLALLATAAIGFGIMRRRKRKAPAIG